MQLTKQEIEESVGQSFPDTKHMIDFISGHLEYMRTHNKNLSKKQDYMIYDMQLVLDLLERNVTGKEENA